MVQENHCPIQNPKQTLSITITIHYQIEKAEYTITIHNQKTRKPNIFSQENIL